MADVKDLKPDTAREDYFYHKGFQDGYKAFRNLPDVSTTERALNVITQNALSQVGDSRKSGYTGE